MTVNDDALERLRAKIDAMGPRLRLERIYEIEGDPLEWELEIDPTTCVVITSAREADDRLVLSADLLRVPALPAKLYETVLLYNSQWRETGGGRIGLDEPGGSLVQFDDLPLDGLTEDGLAHALTTFLGKHAAWRALLSRLAQGDAPASQDGDVLLRL